MMSKQTSDRKGRHRRCPWTTRTRSPNSWKNITYVSTPANLHLCSLFSLSLSLCSSSLYVVVLSALCALSLSFWSVSLVMLWGGGNKKGIVQSRVLSGNAQENSPQKSHRKGTPSPSPSPSPSLLGRRIRSHCSLSLSLSLSALYPGCHCSRCCVDPQRLHSKKREQSELPLLMVGMLKLHPPEIFLVKSVELSMVLLSAIMATSSPQGLWKACVTILSLSLCTSLPEPTVTHAKAYGSSHTISLLSLLSLSQAQIHNQAIEFSNLVVYLLLNVRSCWKPNVARCGGGEQKPAEKDEWKPWDKEAEMSHRLMPKEARESVLRKAKEFHGRFAPQGGSRFLWRLSSKQDQEIK